jgi:membrane protein YdbS with pleckstrin-like domain
MEKLHPGYKWSVRLRGWLLFLFIAIWAGGFWGGIFGSFVAKFLAIFILGVLLTELFIHLAYANWGYEFTKTELKIEKGIIWKVYKSIPYERIQNVDIHRGIIARLLGFSTVLIQTAGYSGYSKGGILAEGYLPAVSVEGAEKIRVFVMKKIGRKSGL